MIPGSANPLLLASAAAAGGYQIERSLRFNSADSAYLSRTPAVAGSRTTWTWAGWVKRSKLGARYTLFAAGADGTEFFFEQSTGADKLHFYYYNNGASAYQGQCLTTAVFRDASAWYHIVLAVDTTQGITSNRCKIYVNGVAQATTFATNFGPSASLDVNNTVSHKLGGPFSAGGALTFDGYLADIYFIDGQALDATAFTEVSATTGQLIPKAYTGTFTGNSFWLKFSDNSAATATTLGKDYSGNSNNWTPNNLSVTAGAGNDSLVDTPTSYGTDTGVGGSVRGNYCTLNPLSQASTATLANGNLDWSTSSSYALVAGTIAMPASGKWYWEITPTTAPTSGIYNQYTGVVENGTKSTNYIEQFGVSNAYAPDGKIYFNGGSAAYGNTWVANDVIGVAVDLDNGAIYYSKNGTWQNSGVPTSGSSQTGAARTNLSGKVLFPAIATNGTITTSSVFNFGQRAFAYTAPSGFKALCDTNLPAPVVAKPNTVMDVKLWTGNATARSITGFNFSPDFVWIKNRADSVAGDHRLFDTVRGATKELYSNLTGAEATETGGLTAFNSDGFSLGTINAVNGNADGIVGWCWDAGSSTVTNTQGSITSQVRANVSAGFSVVTYSTGASSGNQTIGHGLNVTPSLIIHKVYSATSNWWVYHASTTNTVSKYIQLNSTNATADNGLSMWGAALPTSTVFGANVGQLLQTNQSAVAYCFAPVVGYSSFGSYTGNGSADGPFVYTGFKPRWIMFKKSSTTSFAQSWNIFDALRLGYNASNNTLYPNSSSQEVANNALDILSNGFKTRVGDPYDNESGATYIYAAFAENPFQYARAR